MATGYTSPYSGPEIDEKLRRAGAILVVDFQDEFTDETLQEISSGVYSVIRVGDNGVEYGTILLSSLNNLLGSIFQMTNEWRIVTTAYYGRSQWDTWDDFTDWMIANSSPIADKGMIGDLSNLTTTEKSNLVGAVNEVNGQVTELEQEVGGKQDAISDLTTIRSGAGLGATAVQPPAISDMATKTWTNAQGFLKEHQSLSEYRKAAAQDTIDAGKVDKVIGKGLSTNDYTTAEKTKLAGIETGAQKNADNTVVDAAYVHTDNNFTSAEKSKLAELENYDDTAIKGRVSAIEGKEAGWDAKAEVSDIPDVIDNITSTSTTNALSANQGKALNDRINNLATRGRFLSLWDCETGLPLTNPSGYPYNYSTGDFFIVSKVAATNYVPNGSSYQGVPSTTVYSGAIKVNDTVFYDGTSWMVLTTPVASSDIQDVYQNGESVVSNGVAYVVTPTALSELSADTRHRLVTDVQIAAWDDKQDAISDLATIRSNASAGKTASDNLAGHTVAKNVPSDAKFTDTVYDDTALAGRVGVIEGKESTWDAKQDAISDLTTIRSGAELGATAVQPSAISDMATKTWTNAQGFLTEHQSLSEYRKAAAQDAIDEGKVDKDNIATTITPQSVNTDVAGASAVYNAATTPIVESSDTVVTVAMNCGKKYKYMDVNGIASLAFTLNAPTDATKANIWYLKFRSGATATNVSFPSGLWYPNGQQPSIEANTIYEIMIDEDYCLTMQAYKQIIA